MNATLKRTDVHRPSAIIPEDYTYVALENIKIEDMGAVEVILRERRVFKAHQERTGATWSRTGNGGVCHICGTNNAWYTVIFHHVPSNTYIRTGFDCAEKLDYGNDHAFRTFRQACQGALANKAGKAKAQQVLILDGLEDAWEIYCNHDGYVCYGDDGKAKTSNDEPMELLRAKDTVKDIVGKLVKWGDLSAKQAKFLRSLVDKVNNWDKIQAQREAERASIPDVPEGRLQVTGHVVSTKWNDEWDYLQMLVEAVEGFRVWGTVPSSLQGGRGEVKGRKVTFKATITRSDKDSKFGFFKRPSKAEFIDNYLFIS